MKSLTIDELIARRAAADIRATKPRRRKPKPVRPPRTVELEYYRAIRRLLDEAGESVASAMPGILLEVEMSNQQRASRRTDGLAELGQRLSELRQRIASTFTLDALAQIAASVTGRVNARNLGGVTSQMESLGVDLSAALGREPWLQDQMTSFTRQNVGLIQDLATETASRVEKVIWQGTTGGLRVEEIARQVRLAMDTSKTRAAFIARDQVAKFNGQLTRERHIDAGLNEYEWSTSQDARVRHRHAQLHGTIQKWTKPPIVASGKGGPRRAHPGEDYGCRCAAIPKLPKHLEDA